jgi:rep: ATP-dependent DNA helicase Rep
LRAL